jgi:hypothetical protein
VDSLLEVVERVAHYLEHSVEFLHFLYQNSGQRGQKAVCLLKLLFLS